MKRDSSNRQSKNKKPSHNISRPNSMLRSTGKSTSTTMTATTKSNTFFPHPGENDVVFGRGGASIHTPANIRFRNMVRAHQRQYIGFDDSRHMKTLLTHELVSKWRQQGGRFVKQAPDTGRWYDVGTSMARRKTAQLLREGAKHVRKELGLWRQEEQSSGDENDNKEYAKKLKTAAVTTATVPKTIVVSKTNVDDAPLPSLQFQKQKQHNKQVPRMPPMAPPSLFVSTDTVNASHTASLLLRDSIIRSAPKVFYYDQTTSLEMLESVFPDLLGEINSSSSTSSTTSSDNKKYNADSSSFDHPTVAV